MKLKLNRYILLLEGGLIILNISLIFLFSILINNNFLGLSDGNDTIYPGWGNSNEIEYDISHISILLFFNTFFFVISLFSIYVIRRKSKIKNFFLNFFLNFYLLIYLGIYLFNIDIFVNQSSGSWIFILFLILIFYPIVNLIFSFLITNIKNEN